MSGDAAYFASLARKQVGAGALFTDDEGRVLLVQRAYGDGSWTVPGGSVDAGETPLNAVRREVLEELGLTVEIGRLLAVDWIPQRQQKPEALVFLFDGGHLTPEQVTQIKLPADELTDHRFASMEEAAAMVTERMHRRLAATLERLRSGSALYFEDGYRIR